MEDLNYEDDVRIDPDALDIEWLEHPNTVLKYGKRVANLRHEVNRLKERKKTKRSELIDRANRNPVECCAKEKPNKEDIEAYYRNHKEYKDVIRELLDAEYELEYAEVAYDVMNYHRKPALANLVVLHGQQYFAGPKIPRDLRKEVDEHLREREEANRKIAESMRGKIRRRRGVSNDTNDEESD